MINEQYNLWCNRATLDPDLTEALKTMSGNEDAIHLSLIHI